MSCDYLTTAANKLILRIRDERNSKDEHQTRFGTGVNPEVVRLLVLARTCRRRLDRVT